MTCRNYKGGPIQCKARAILDPEKLQVIKFFGEHECVADPDLKYQIRMETEMKALAETSADSLRDIFDRVCRKSPSVAQRLSFERMKSGMKQRRMKARNDVVRK